MSVTITLPNDVAEKLFKKLEWSDDCGPKSEGWQLPLNQSLLSIKNIIVRNTHTGHLTTGEG